MNKMELIALFESFGMRKSAEPKQIVSVAKSELSDLQWTDNAEQLKQTKIGAFTLKCTKEVYGALNFASTLKIGLFKEEIEGKQIAWARVIGAE